MLENFLLQVLAALARVKVQLSRSSKVQELRFGKRSSCLPLMQSHDRKARWLPLNGLLVLSVKILLALWRRLLRCLAQIRTFLRD